MAGYGMPDDEGAAFGVYPQLARRRESSNDREGAREVPVQAARGMLAGTLGMAGDLEGLARTGARYLGANVQEAPALPTSDEFRERLPVPATSPAGRVAGAVGAAVGLPAGGFGMKAAKEAAPAVRRIAAEVAENAHRPQPLNRAAHNQMGAIVFHGSPHRFEKFDSAKIGTGEGNQAYGHGVYLAENRGVADSYRRNLTDMNGGLAKVDHYGGLLGSGPMNTVEQGMEGQQQLISHLERKLAANPKDPFLSRMLEVERGRLSQFDDVGSLYKVDLADEAIPRMIDWDAPLARQPEALRELVAPLQLQKAGPHATGRLAYHGIVNDAGRQIDNRAGPMWEAIKDDPSRLMYRPADVATRVLRERGMPGIKYQDEFSRGMNEAGTHNFVVFPGEAERLLKILERNGRPLE